MAGGRTVGAAAAKNERDKNHRDDSPEHRGHGAELRSDPAKRLVRIRSGRGLSTRSSSALDREHVRGHGVALGGGQSMTDRHLADELQHRRAGCPQSSKIAALATGTRASRQRVTGAAVSREQPLSARRRLSARASAPPDGERQSDHRHETGPRHAVERAVSHAKRPRGVRADVSGWGRRAYRRLRLRASPRERVSAFRWRFAGRP